MTRANLVDDNTTLRDAFDDIEDVITGFALKAQSSLNMGDLEAENSRLAVALTLISERVINALALVDDSDEAEDDNDDDDDDDDDDDE